MNGLAQFVTSLALDGVIRFGAAPLGAASKGADPPGAASKGADPLGAASKGADPDEFAPETLESDVVLEALRREHRRDARDLAGPVPPFVPEVAIWAVEMLHRACWLAAAYDQPAEEVATQLRPGPTARGPGCHASADLALRLLPMLLRRARARDRDDPLIAHLVDLLARWPLSGVLADLDGPPAVAPRFGHEGLALRYAERLRAHPKSAWIPPDGPERAWWDRLGQGLA